MSPTARSIEELKGRGYTTWVVEHYNYFSKRRIDLYNCIDIIAIKKGKTLAVQTTSRSNINSRVKKIKANEYLDAMLSAGWDIEVHGWGKMVIGKFKNGNKKRGYVNKIIKITK